MLAFSIASFLALYGILRLQAFLPFNPQGFANVEPGLAFNTAVSFVTNTNWQNYAGEATMSNFSQMAGLTVQNFLSAAVGMALAIAFTRAFVRSQASTLGNFWVDMTRATLYVLLPIAVIVAVMFVAMGLPQTMDASVTATTLEGSQQVISLGPVASQEAIKQLGTNGGGFFNANAAHPFENPTALSNYLNIFSMLTISAAFIYTFGQMVGSRRQGWVLLTAMAVLLIAGVATVYWAESAGNPILTSIGVDAAQGNMEGKEVRFGQAMTALYAAVTTGLSDGGVNGMHGSFTGLVASRRCSSSSLARFCRWCGIRSLRHARLRASVGLRRRSDVGRTPEFLGKKIEGREMKFAMLAVLILPTVILGFTALSAMLPFAVASIGTGGPHGLSEILYAFTSAAGNNGSAFGGLSGNTDWYNTTLGISMLLGRFAYVVPVMGDCRIACRQGSGSGLRRHLPDGWPALCRPSHRHHPHSRRAAILPRTRTRPIVEHFAMLAGQTF